MLGLCQYVPAVPSFPVCVFPVCVPVTAVSGDTKEAYT